MSASKAAIKSGNIGARASGPKPCVKLTELAADMAKAFHMGDQFYLSSVPCSRREERTMYQGISFVCRGLGYENLACTLHEVMATNIRHNLRAWQDLDAELLLDSMELLQHCQLR